MAFKITDDCISCGACESECKNEAIKEGDTSYVIDPAKCTECVGWFNTQKCAEVCPVDAPKADPANQESKAQLLEKWKKLNPGKTPEPGTY
ncbi:MAG TPA: 4Fe-4S ferredoxin [Dehalococcoidia bacterium]|nr:4Fe-4S ferredoxin [Dehalococcoidia bacterium]